MIRAEERALKSVGVGIEVTSRGELTIKMQEILSSCRGALARADQLQDALSGSDPKPPMTKDEPSNLLETANAAMDALSLLHDRLQRLEAML